MKTTDLLDEATSLPLEERARLVDSLLQTLNRPSDTHAAAWIETARRRLAEVRSGTVVPVPGESVFERIQQRYGQ